MLVTDLYYASVHSRVAIEVPEILFVAYSLQLAQIITQAVTENTVGDPIQALMTSTPGAKISTTAPKLLNEALASVIVVAPTVTACGTCAGEVFLASLLSFPAATAKWMLALIAYKWMDLESE